MAESSGAIEKMPRVATIATLASRIESFRKVLPVIHAQVDHMFVYLDGYSEPPDFLGSIDRITVCRAESLGDLHADSRLLCLQELKAPTVVIVVDDDIMYPQDYVYRLVKALQRVDGQAIVGVHGRIFLPPHQSYVKHATYIHFSHELKDATYVHELGTGTCALISSIVPIDPRAWKRHDMADIMIAIDAQRRGLPRIALARPVNWLMAYAERQQDSMWTKTLADDSEQSRQMRALLSLYG